MSVKINLLPQNLQVSKGLLRILKTIKAINVIATVVFIVFVLGLSGFFIIEKVNLSNLQKNVDQLKTKVSAQQGSEQVLILIKDRLSKISSIKTKATATKNVVNSDFLFTNLSDASVVNVGDIDVSKVETSLLIVSNSDLNNLMQNIRENTLFKTIEMTSLGFAPGQGLNINLKLSNE